MNKIDSNNNGENLESHRTLSTNENRPLVVDLILFNGEVMGLYRLEYLKDVVDYFLILEATTTFTGNPKKLYLNESIPILDELRTKKKLIEVIVDDLPTGTGEKQKKNKENWSREKYMRNVGVQQTQKIFKDKRFVLLVTDADELPRKEYVAKFPEMYDEIGQGMRLVMMSMIYNFRWMLTYSYGNAWFFPYVITDAGIVQRNATLDAMRSTTKYMASMTHIWHAGWHCSYCMDIDEIIRKIESFSHQELNNAMNKDPVKIKNYIEKGEYLFKKSSNTNIHKYICENYGLPICDNCNIKNPTYSVLHLHNSTCATINANNDIIHVEYRNEVTGDREYRPHKLPYFKDISEYKIITLNASDIIRKPPNRRNRKQIKQNKIRNKRQIDKKRDLN